MASDPGARYQDLLELAKRLLNHGHPEGQASVEVFPRGWPDAHRAEVPMPSGAQLLGTSLYSVDGRPTYLTAIFETSEEPATVMRAYESQLRDSGWSVFEQFGGGMRGGFVPAGFSGLGNQFTRGDEAPVLMVSLRDATHGGSELRLRLDWDIKRRMPPPHRAGPAGAERMPSLVAPAGVPLIPRGGGGSDGNWHTDAIARTDKPVDELEAHFAEQLSAAGWKRLGGGSDDVVAWSSWQLPGDGGWHGLLLVMAAFDRGARVLSLRIESDGGSGSGWYSSMSSLTG